MLDAHKQPCRELLKQVEVKYILDFMQAYTDHQILPIIEEMLQACIQSTVDTNKAFDEGQAPIFELVKLHQFIVEAYAIYRNHTWKPYEDTPLFAYIDGEMRISLPAAFVTRSRPLNNSQWPETVLLRSWAMAEPSIVEDKLAKLKAVLDLSLALFQWQRLVEALQADLKAWAGSGEPTGDRTCMENIGAIPICDLVLHPQLQPQLTHIQQFLSFIQLPDYAMQFAMIIYSSALRRNPKAIDHAEAKLLSGFRVFLSALRFVGLFPFDGATPPNLRGAFDRGGSDEIKAIVRFVLDFDKQQWANMVFIILSNVNKHRGHHDTLVADIDSHILYSLRDAITAFMEIFKDPILAIAGNMDPQ